MLCNGVSVIWFHFYSRYLSNWLFAEEFSNCSNSLNFEAKINCNSIKPNVPKWRKICFDLVPFYGPQTKFKNIDNFGGPCSSAGMLAIHNQIRNAPVFLCCIFCIYLELVSVFSFNPHAQQLKILLILRVQQRSSLTQHNQFLCDSVTCIL